MSNSQEIYNWKQLRVCEDGMEAQLIRNLLEINDIPVQLFNVNSNSLFPDTSLINVIVKVPESFLEKAQDLLKENFD